VKRLLAAAMVIPVGLAVAVVAKASASPADYSCDSGGSCGGSGSGTGPTCLPSNPYLSVPDRLYSASGTSDSDVWAAGLMPSSSLIMHWNGSCWSVSYDEPVGFFYGVSAVSTSDAWAVGGTSWWNPSQTLAEHWDGTSWTVVPTPIEGGSALFNAVAATSAANAWAVGEIGPGPGVPAAASPLIEHWDGSAWSAQPFAVPITGGTFTDVAATSPDNAWAVGYTGTVSEGTGQTTVIEHWDGSSWTRVSSPDPAGSANFLNGVAIIAPDDIWAVGFTISGSGVAQSLTMNWDGSTWSVVPSPNATSDGTVLHGVAGAASNDVWAVGQNPSCTCETVAMHWNGSTWTVVSTPDPPTTYLNTLLGVTAISGDDVWAVGSANYASTLIEHWDGSSWRD
jgi:hypothetical protein